MAAGEGVSQSGLKRVQPAVVEVVEAELALVVLPGNSPTLCAGTRAPPLQRHPLDLALEDAEKLLGAWTTALHHPGVVDHFGASPDAHAHIDALFLWLLRVASRVP